MGYVYVSACGRGLGRIALSPPGENWDERGLRV